MSTIPPRSSHVPTRGFTLVEIMIVVVIIGLLAALAIPAFQRVQRASQNARVINDFRVFAQAFEIYNAQNGAWPANVSAGVVPTSPVSMASDFKVASWQAVTAIGGHWNWDNSLSGGGDAGISISSYICDDAQLAEIDAKMDDGDLTTGNFVQVSSSRVRLILARP
ncbi:MAG TPA: prepilin-type N-terminal cleavage/methylation domain-containing protein [Lacunisphaera sp.]|nr:prepilin-type N-terminal cleavage/methylation domain-containing protein [Lacunisphaera sp.]